MKKQTRRVSKSKNQKMVGGNAQKDESKTLCIVHAVWCGHCQAMMEQKNEDGKTLWELIKEKIGDKCQMNDYEESENKEKIETLKTEKGLVVDGFPTIFKLVNDKIEYYQGSRDVDSIVNWTLGNESINSEEIIQKGGKRRRKTRTVKKRRNTWWF